MPLHDHVISPLPSNWDPKANTGTATAAEVTNYQSIIGSLLYLMIGTRPDIAYAVTHFSQFCTNPSPEHYKAALHICRYLVGTQCWIIILSIAADQIIEFVFYFFQAPFGSIFLLSPSYLRRCIVSDYMVLVIIFPIFTQQLFIVVDSKNV